MEKKDVDVEYDGIYGQHKVFNAEAGSPGICVRSNRVIAMESTEINDPKVETFAAMAVRDTAYMRDVAT